MPATGATLRLRAKGTTMAQRYDTPAEHQNDGQPQASPLKIPKGADLGSPPQREPIPGNGTPPQPTPGDKTAYTGQGVLKIQPANKWIADSKLRPTPKRLFGDLWFEGELCILFADTNVGKSILAVQAGEGISRGKNTVGFEVETGGQTVLYCDFELSDKQFEVRYSDGFKNPYEFSPIFHRAEIDPDTMPPAEYANNFEGFLSYSLEKAIRETGAKILIIDNLTYLRTDTEKARDALPLMKLLKALKSKYGLSILCLAHTPKRDLSKPISRNDLMGSKMLINFCDSCFAIGESQKDKSWRYIKQIKARNTEIIYDAENVVVCQITKPDNFLKFDYVEQGNERDHLRAPSDQEREDLKASVKAEYDKNPEETAYQIAKKVADGLPEGHPDKGKFNSLKVRVTRIVNRLKKEGNSNS